MMRQIMNALLKPTLLGLITLSLAVPAMSEAAEKKPVKTVKKSAAHQGSRTKAKVAKAAGKKKSYASSRKASQKVSRYGKKRQAVASRGSRRYQQAVADVAPRRAYNGPTEIIQIADANSPLLLQSRAALVMDAETGAILYGKNTNRTMPIASITKLMTSMVVLDAHLPMEELVTITEDDVDHYKNTSSRLTVGTTLPRSEILLLALMASENRAAHALARTYPGGTQAAVAAMNRKAKSLGMQNTYFLDPTGLHSENQSSPRDLTIMVQAAAQYQDIHHASTTAEHTITGIGGRQIAYRNTNALVKSDSWDIGVSKTGFINEAGKCLVMQARIKQKPVVIVLMDSWGSYTRIGDANRVKKWLESAIN